jgi:hypothetical protein
VNHTEGEKFGGNTKGLAGFKRSTASFAKEKSFAKTSEEVPATELIRKFLLDK